MTIQDRRTLAASTATALAVATILALLSWPAMNLMGRIGDGAISPMQAVGPRV